MKIDFNESDLLREILNFKIADRKHIEEKYSFKNLDYTLDNLNNFLLENNNDIIHKDKNHLFYFGKYNEDMFRIEDREINMKMTFRRELITLILLFGNEKLNIYKFNKNIRRIQENNRNIQNDLRQVLKIFGIKYSEYEKSRNIERLFEERGYDFKVFADETRPLLQGARLTAWELDKAGIDVTLICDNMASIVMKNGWIDAVVVGCDRLAANGDGANKIGTSGVAILAKEYGIPFYMFVPTSTIDLETETGEDIPIELRNGDEIYKMWYEKDMAPKGIKTYNPSFDVTSAEYITAIITEKGIVRPPYKENLIRLMRK